MPDNAWSDSDPTEESSISKWLDNELMKDAGAAVSDAILGMIQDAQIDPREKIRVDRVLKKYHVFRPVYHALKHASPKERVRHDGRPQIVIDPNERKIADQAIGALSKRQDFYQRGGLLVQIVTGRETSDGIERPKDLPGIVPAPCSQVRSKLADSIVWLKQDRIGNLKAAHPPDWIARDIFERGEWMGVRHLLTLTQSPIMRADGSILEKAGYDESSGIEYRPNSEYPPVGDPSSDDARAAVKALYEVICDFPMKSGAHAAAWLAGVLTPLARNAFSGPAPLFLLDANTRGSGKSLLADVTAQIAVGRLMARMPQSKDEEEDRKRITAIALQGDTLVLIDNITRTFGNGAIDAALTSTIWQERILGSNQRPNLPLRATWYATGNNVMLRGDTSRRCLHIRLESPLEHPEDRADFKHHDLIKWVHGNRAYLVVCALRILRAYYLANCPSQSLTPWGSFQGWSDMVRSAIVWAGGEDPCGTRIEFRKHADMEAENLPALLEGIGQMAKNQGQIISGARGLTARNIVVFLEKSEGGFELLREALANLGWRLTASSLGARLRGLRGRNVGGLMLDSVRRGNVSYWYVMGGEACSS